MLKGPDARMHDAEIPAVVRAGVASKAAARTRGRLRNAFAKRQQASRANKTIEAWTKRLALIGINGIKKQNIQITNPKRQQAANQLNKRKRRHLGVSATATAKQPKNCETQSEHQGGGEDPIVADSPFKDQHVRVVQDKSLYDQDIGRQGTVQEVRVSSTNVQRALIVTDGKVDGCGVTYINADISCLVLTSGDTGKTKPAPIMLDYSQIPPEQGTQWLSELNATQHTENLEFAQAGQTLELQTVAAGILEMQTRLPNVDAHVMTPAEASSFTKDTSSDDPMTPGQKAAFDEAHARLVTVIDQCRFVAAVIHQPGHFIAFVARRNNYGECQTLDFK